ncbi:unnamed protein product [Prorocentrum cordatum]|uniref:Uncharacterized protein n=1 Tax=Prorocentrum cordatum TaxID=2364126 RepID=A0ABN9UK87_9DINO|nr:unnamed protein product [Polarella glacialis]
MLLVRAIWQLQTYGESMLSAGQLGDFEAFMLHAYESCCKGGAEAQTWDPDRSAEALRTWLGWARELLQWLVGVRHTGTSGLGGAVGAASARGAPGSGRGALAWSSLGGPVQLLEQAFTASFCATLILPRAVHQRCCPPMARCAFGVETFYQAGVTLCSILSLTALTVALQCPYREFCPWAQRICWATVCVASLLACVMLQNYWALQHVRFMNVEDLSPIKQADSRATWRWGLTARTFPLISRALFVLSGAAALAGLLVGLLHCPASPGAQHVCAAPRAGPPDPKVEFGAPCALWLLMALVGSRTSCSQTLPFLFDAVPADVPDGKGWGRCARFAVKVAKMVHP